MLLVFLPPSFLVQSGCPLVSACGAFALSGEFLLGEGRLQRAEMTALGLASVHLHNQHTNAESESRTATFPGWGLRTRQEEAATDVVGEVKQVELTVGGGGEENHGWRCAPRKTTEFCGWLEPWTSSGLISFACSDPAYICYCFRAVYWTVFDSEHFSNDIADYIQRANEMPESADLCTKCID
jgi:hypothetical protein